MKFAKIALAAVTAAVILGGCCSTMKSKCYPYPLYDYSPAKVCGSACVPCPAPVAPYAVK